jgi:hypothetical protein
LASCIASRPSAPKEQVDRLVDPFRRTFVQAEPVHILQQNVYLDQPEETPDLLQRERLLQVRVA